MRLLLILTISLITIAVMADPTAVLADTPLADFADRFEDATLRIDYTHTGDAETEFVALGELWKQGAGAG